MKYLIIGRTASGKSTFGRILEKIGKKGVVSYTTRPKRNEDDNDHIFITPEEAKTYTDKVATTTINGYEYFATRKQVSDADYYIIDPNGFYELTDNMPEENFLVINIQADEKDRKKAYLSRESANEIEFQKRNKAENRQFTEFERNLANQSEKILNKQNFITCIQCTNEFDDLHELYMLLYSLLDGEAAIEELENTLVELLEELPDNPFIDISYKNNKQYIKIKQENGFEIIPTESFIYMLATNPDLNDNFYDMIHDMILDTELKSLEYKIQDKDDNHKKEKQKNKTSKIIDFKTKN